MQNVVVVPMRMVMVAYRYGEVDGSNDNTLTIQKKNSYKESRLESRVYAEKIKLVGKKNHFSSESG